MTILNNFAQLLLFFAAWLLPFVLVLVVAGLVQRQRRAGQIALLLAGVFLLLLGAAYAGGDLSWQLLPALVNGYSYDPNAEMPDPRLVPRRPELIIERQLAALVSQTGPAPLHTNLPLTSYTIDAVHINGWHNRHWLTAVVDVTLTFADQIHKPVSLTLPAKGGSYVLVPFLGEVNRSAYAWYAPESSLGHLLQTPAPVTPLRDDTPPLNLAPAGTVDVTGLEGVNPQTGFATVSALAADGTLLLDMDLRWEQTRTGSALLWHANGQTRRLADTRLAARAVFAPDGERIAYIRSPWRGDLQLVVREADGQEREFAAVDWMTHHWVNDNQIAYSYNATAYLYDLNSGEARSLVALPPHEFYGGQKFRVSPDGERIAYVDMNGRLWIQEIANDERQHVGWGVGEIGWGSGLVWRGDGQQLLFITRDTTTLPGQPELWLWDVDSGRTRLLVRAGPGFLGGRADETVNLGQACWADEATILLTAYVPGYRDDVHLLAVQTDGSGVWDVTPAAGLTYPQVHCANGYVAANSKRTAVALYEIRERDA